jgi:hypothetical protein
MAVGITPNPNVVGPTGPTGPTGSTGSAGATGASGTNLAGFNAQTGTTYTLVIGDKDDMVTLNNSSAVTVTIPASVFAANDIVNVQQIGTGQVTLQGASGTTITSNGATSTAPKLRVRYSAASVICSASNTFTVIGDIS